MGKQCGVHTALTKKKLFRDKIFYDDAGEENQTSVRQLKVNFCSLRVWRLRSCVAMRYGSSTTNVVPTDYAFLVCKANSMISSF